MPETVFSAHNNEMVRDRINEKGRYKDEHKKTGLYYLG